MSFTRDNQLEKQDTGQADWDTGLSANFDVLERGFHVRATAGLAIASGQMCMMNSGSYVIPYDARSLSLPRPHFISYRSVNSGEEASFIREGVVRSMTVWSGRIVPGEPFYSAVASIGFAVSSFLGSGHPGGLAIGVDAVYFAPGKFSPFPDRVTLAQSVGPIQVGTYSDFTMGPGQRGIVVGLRVRTDSADGYKVSFWSNSSRVGSELQYDTLTSSKSIGSVDITTLHFFDAAPWPHNSTNVASLGLLYGRIAVQSGSTVNTGQFSVEMIMERMR